MSMADYRKTGNIQETPFGYTLSVIGGKWKMENANSVSPFGKSTRSL